MRRVRLVIVCSCAVLLCFLWAVGSTGGQEERLGSSDLDVILLIDNSNSMSAPGGNDPGRLRIRAAQFLVDYLRAIRATTKANYWVGIANFGTVVGDAIALRLLQDDTLRDRIREEALIYTDFGPPLEFARNELRPDFGTNKKLLVLLFTDGQPQLTDEQMSVEEVDAYFRALAPLTKELQDGGAQIYVLAIGAAHADRSRWEKEHQEDEGLLPQGHFVAITSTADLADVYHHIVGSLLKVDVSSARTLPPGQEVTVEIGPYLEQAVFSFLKSDPAIQLDLLSPDSTPMVPSHGGTETIYHTIYTVANPAEGLWKVRWEGTGTVQYWVDRQYPSVALTLDAPLPYAGQPVTITASVVRNGEVLTDVLRLEAEITDSSGVTTTTTLKQRTRSGSHVGVFHAPAASRYTITVRTYHSGTVLPARSRPAVIQIMALPPPPTLMAQATQVPAATGTPSLTATAAATAPPDAGPQVTTTAPSATRGQVTPPASAATPASGARAPVWARSLPPLVWWLALVIVLASLVGLAYLIDRPDKLPIPRIDVPASDALGKPETVDRLIAELYSGEGKRRSSEIEAKSDLVGDLENRIIDAFSNTCNHYFVNALYEAAKHGNPDAQYCFARGLLRRAAEQNDLSPLYIFPGVFSWAPAFNTAIQTPTVANMATLTPIWEKYSRILQLRDPYVREIATCLDELKQALHNVSDKDEFYKSYDHLYSLLMQRRDDIKPIPKQQTPLISFQLVLDLADEMVALASQQKFDNARVREFRGRIEELHRDYEISRVDYLILETLTRKYGNHQ